MATQQKQIRYVVDGHTFNSNNATRENLVSGACFTSGGRILKMKITAIPGFGVFLNDTPFPLRVLNNGDAQPKEAFTYTIPESALLAMPLYSIKCEAASLDRLINYNIAYPDQPHYLMIDYTEEVNGG